MELPVFIKRSTVSVGITGLLGKSILGYLLYQSYLYASEKDTVDLEYNNWRRGGGSNQSTE